MPREKLTKHAIEEAVRLRRAGVLDKDIAAYVGVRPDTFSKWVNHPRTKNQTQLSQALKREEANRKASLLTIIYDAAVKRDWKAAAWLLERQHPEEFGRYERSSVDARVEAAPAFFFSREDAEAS